jgi:2-polyprenyl-6-hydroxyphenyl methylase / 3-demethylubiquinone-9 3-methyltransferase
MKQLEYPAEHWAKDRDPLSALHKIVQLGALPFNIVQWEMFTGLLPSSLSGKAVLDYGCGVGDLSLYCARQGAMVQGIDRSEAAIGAAQYQAIKQNLADRCRFDVREDIGTSQYDLVLAKDVIEHIQDDEQWLANVAAALKPNGLFIFATHNDRCLNYLVESAYHRWWKGDQSWMGWDPTHVRFYNAWTLSRLLTKHGLKVHQWASMWIIPYNIIHWLTLFKWDRTLLSLGYFDRWFGKYPPFNRLGWGLMAVSGKTASNHKSSL